MSAEAMASGGGDSEVRSKKYKCTYVYAYM